MNAKDFIYQHLLQNPSIYPTKWHLLRTMLLTSSSPFIWNSNGSITTRHFYYEDQEIKEITEEDAIARIDFFYDIFKHDIKDYMSEHVKTITDVRYNLTINNIKNMKYSVLETDVPNDIIIDYNTFNISYKKILNETGKFIDIPKPAKTALIYNIPDNITDDWKQEIRIFYNAFIKPVITKFSYQPYYINNIITND